MTTNERKQTPDHVAARTASMLATKAARTHKVCLDCKQLLPVGDFDTLPRRGTPTPRCSACLARRRAEVAAYREGRSRAVAARSLEERRAINSRKSQKHWHLHKLDKLEARRYMNRQAVLKRNYGMTMDQYDWLAASCGGRCGICGTSDPGRGNQNMPVDHDHVTGRWRGILCDSCNRGLGFFKDSPETLAAAIRYLEQRS